MMMPRLRETNLMVVMSKLKMAINPSVSPNLISIFGVGTSRFLKLQLVWMFQLRCGFVSVGFVFFRRHPRERSAPLLLHGYFV